MSAASMSVHNKDKNRVAGNYSHNCTGKRNSKSTQTGFNGGRAEVEILFLGGRNALKTEVKNHKEGIWLTYRRYSLYLPVRGLP